MEHYFMKRDRTVFNKSNRKLLLILRGLLSRGRLKIGELLL